MEDREHPVRMGVSLSLEVTTNCNSSCSHCFVRARGPKKSHLPAGIVQDIVGEGYREGYRHLHITGGEPLMWDGLSPVLDYAFNTGYKTVFLNTNGTLLLTQLSRELARHQGLSISVSLQGPRNFHDRVRGKGSYSLALKGVENALAAGIPVHIFTPVSRSLIPELPHFVSMILESYPDIKLLHLIQLIRVPADIFDLSEELLKPDDFLGLVRMATLLKLNGLKIDLLHNPLANVVSRILNMKWLPSSLPLYQSGSIMITAEGRITLAHSTSHDFGAYESGSIRNVLNSDDYAQVVSRNLITCGNCVYSRLCAEEGMVRPSEWYRDMSPQLPYCKRVLALASCAM